MINRKAAAVAGAAALALILSSCAESERDSGGENTDTEDTDTGGTATGEAGGGEDQPSDATFVFGAAGAPTTFDPFYASDGETFRVTRQIFQNLIGIEEGGSEAVPELATEWTSDDSGLVWTSPSRRA